jgi:hypothetical protein
MDGSSADPYQKKVKINKNQSSRPFLTDDSFFLDDALDDFDFTFEPSQPVANEWMDWGTISSPGNFTPRSEGGHNIVEVSEQLRGGSIGTDTDIYADLLYAQEATRAFQASGNQRDEFDGDHFHEQQAAIDMQNEGILPSPPALEGGGGNSERNRQMWGGLPQSQHQIHRTFVARDSFQIDPPTSHTQHLDVPPPNFEIPPVSLQQKLRLPAVPKTGAFPVYSNTAPTFDSSATTNRPNVAQLPFGNLPAGATNNLDSSSKPHPKATSTGFVGVAGEGGVGAGALPSFPKSSSSSNLIPTSAHLTEQPAGTSSGGAPVPGMGRNPLVAGGLSNMVVTPWGVMPMMPGNMPMQNMNMPFMPMSIPTSSQPGMPASTSPPLRSTGSTISAGGGRISTAPPVTLPTGGTLSGKTNSTSVTTAVPNPLSISSASGTVNGAPPTMPGMTVPFFGAMGGFPMMPFPGGAANQVAAQGGVGIRRPMIMKKAEEVVMSQSFERLMEESERKKKDRQVVPPSPSPSPSTPLPCSSSLPTEVGCEFVSLRRS